MMINTLQWSLVIAIFTLTGSETPSLGIKIVQGNFVEIEKHPYMAQIVCGGKCCCGGTVISSKWILTAAHCVLRNEGLIKTHLLKVILGSALLDKGTSYAVQQIITHPLYDWEMLLSDIAMLQIEGVIDFGPTVSIANLNLVEKPSEDYKNCSTAGWGVSDPETLTRLDQLQELELHGIPLTNCAPYAPFRTNICAVAYQEGATPCFGDSGGPLVCDGVQVGILSYGPKNCTINHPKVYTSVVAYYSWIRGVLKFDGDHQQGKPKKILQWWYSNQKPKLDDIHEDILQNYSWGPKRKLNYFFSKPIANHTKPVV